MNQRYSRGIAVTAMIAAIAVRLPGQSPSSLTLTEARQIARTSSAELVAAREAVNVAIGRERQSQARLNPVIAYGREQTSGGGQRNAQDVLGVDHTIELPGMRSARRDAARNRREAAEARVAWLEAQVDFDVARAYALTSSGDRRAALAAEVAKAFATAVTISDRRLREGDISGFAARRIRLEAVRYATVEAEAALTRRENRLNLGLLLATGTASVHPFEGALTDSALRRSLSLSTDSLIARALANRGDVRAAVLEIAAAEADARLAAAERTPAPTVSAGLKRESMTGVGGMSGFIAGVSVPLALFDRRHGAIVSADAEARRRQAEVEVLRRHVAREVIESVEALRAVQTQWELLSSQALTDAAAALRSAQTAYNEGEISLLEWLDTVRAYQETEAMLATLRAEYIIRVAAVERAAGISILGGPR
jgi:outer membrane protein, heavy metal efflux system